MEQKLLDGMRASMVQAKNTLDTMRKEIDKAKLAGLDVGQAEEDYQKLRDRLARMVAVYGA